MGEPIRKTAARDDVLRDFGQTHRVVLIDPSDPELKEFRTDDLRFPGARHTAASRFCRSQNRGTPALAVVASQDDKLSLFIRRPDEVVIFSPYMRGVGFML